MSGWARTSAHWVGTPWPTVTASFSMSRIVVPAVQGVGVITVAIILEISSQALVM